MRYSATCLLALIATTSSANAQEQGEYWSDRLWVVVEDEDGGCGMIGYGNHRTNGPSSFFLTYRPTESELRLAFTSEVTTSLPDSGNVHLDMDILRGDDFEEFSGQFTYLRSEEGHHIFFTHFRGRENIADFWNELARGEALLINYEESFLAGMRLAGSANALEQLRSCAFGASGLDTRDPFAG